VAIEERCWTLQGAQAVFPDVRARTARAVAEVERLAAERDAQPERSRARQQLERRIRAVMERWAREMEAFGAEVKGLWLVDFDNGSGYYCWRWPEPALGHFHSYEEGFDARTPIQ
jgi:hypothetical protein